MSSKKYYTDLEKDTINAVNVVNTLKESIIETERDVTNIHQNLKSIGLKIYYL